MTDIALYLGGPVGAGVGFLAGGIGSVPGALAGGMLGFDAGTILLSFP